MMHPYFALKTVSIWIMLVATFATNHALAGAKSCAHVLSKHERLIEAAQHAGLHYTQEFKTGIQREIKNDKALYYSPDGELIKSETQIARYNALRIPPGYTQVWISTDPMSHIQATALDSKGRRQYRYHPQWTKIASEFKFKRIIKFGQELPQLRNSISKDLSRPELDEPKVIATILRLLEITAIRIGNEEYAADNGTYGLTTMLKKHVQIKGDNIAFDFVGKGHVEHEFDVRDESVAKILKQLLVAHPKNKNLFLAVSEKTTETISGTTSESGQTQLISADQVNASIKTRMGDDFSAKDFRTWIATTTAAEFLAKSGPVSNFEKEYAEVEKNAVLAASARLRNTPEVCRHNYIHPKVFELYRRGKLHTVYQKLQHQRLDRPIGEELVLTVLD